MTCVVIANLSKIVNDTENFRVVEKSKDMADDKE